MNKNNIIRTIFISTLFSLFSGCGNSDNNLEQNLNKKVAIENGYINHKILQKEDYTPSFNLKPEHYVLNQDLII